MEIFNKVLIGNYKPNSNCFVDDGHLLTVIPKKINKIRENIDYMFSDLQEPIKKSIYGWVKDSEPFILEDYCTKFTTREINDAEREHIRLMLISISKLIDGTPVKVRYSERGILEKKMELVVHKVFFY